MASGAAGEWTVTDGPIIGLGPIVPINTAELSAVFAKTDGDVVPWARDIISSKKKIWPNSDMAFTEVASGDGVAPERHIFLTHRVFSPSRDEAIARLIVACVVTGIGHKNIAWRKNPTVVMDDDTGIWKARCRVVTW